MFISYSVWLGLVQAFAAQWAFGERDTPSQHSLSGFAGGADEVSVFAGHTVADFFISAAFCTGSFGHG